MRGNDVAADSTAFRARETARQPMTSTPPMYGASAFGTSIRPSARW
jgi:hypothetical protein